MTSEMRARTNKTDVLKKTSIMREKQSRSIMSSASLNCGLSSIHGGHSQLTSVHLQCAHNSPLTMMYKECCFSNYVQPHNQVTNS